MFTIIDRYILRHHIPTFLFGTGVGVFLFLMQFLMNQLDKFIGKGLSVWVILQVITYNLAWMVVLAVPMGVLFSVVLTFGNLSSNSEITVIKASGAGLIRMMRVIILAGLILSYLLYLFNDYVLPEANHQAKILMADINRKKPTFALESGQFSQAISGYTILARKVDSISGKLTGVTIYDNTKMFTQNIISADSGYIKSSPTYSKMVIRLYSGEMHQIFKNRDDIYRVINFQEGEIYADASDFFFSRSNADVFSRGDREMRISDMQKIIDGIAKNQSEKIKDFDSLLINHLNYLLYGTQPNITQKFVSHDLKNVDDETRSKIEALKTAEIQLNHFRVNLYAVSSNIEGYQDRIDQYSVEIQKKYSIPFACLVFVLIAAPLGVIIRRGNFGVAAGISLLFYVFNWVSLIGGEKLADRGIISPVLSMWGGDILVAIAGIILMIRVNNESFQRKFTDFFKKLREKE
jgi:lipopolysaccharide export system permease protein